MLMMQGLGLFFLCAVVSPHGSCRTGAPGVKFSISVSVLSLLVTQALVFTAIGLLPRAKRRGTLSLTGERSNREKSKARRAAAAVLPLTLTLTRTLTLPLTLSQTLTLTPTPA